jgi:hypothetical protein
MFATMARCAAMRVGRTGPDGTNLIWRDLL